MAAVRGRPSGLPGFLDDLVFHPAYSCHPSCGNGGGNFMLIKESS